MAVDLDRRLAIIILLLHRSPAFSAFSASSAVN